MFILAKPCLFLSRSDCYSEGWDGSFSQSACFQGANNESLSIWRHKGKTRSPSSHGEQSSAARPHASYSSVSDKRLEDPWLQPHVHSSLQRGAEARGKAEPRGTAATRPGCSKSPALPRGGWVRGVGRAWQSLQGGAALPGQARWSSCPRCSSEAAAGPGLALQITVICCNFLPRD